MIRVAKSYLAYFRGNGLSPRALGGFVPDLIGQALRYQYIHWPRALAKYVRGKDVLDVGCGMGLHCVGFVNAGVKTYTGCDPAVKLQSDQIKQSGKKERASCGWTPDAIMKRLPQVKLFRGGIDDLPVGETFDVAVLHNTTEHLLEVEAVLRSVYARLRPGGLVIFNHHNYYSWNGHHMPPKRVAEIEPGNVEQQKYVDWAHVTLDPEPGSYIARGLNRISLDDLRTLVERDFEIVEWREEPSTESGGLDRYNETIARRYPAFTERELLTHHVFCVGRRAV